MSGSSPFTADEITAIRRYCGYPAFAAYGYILGGDEMATMDAQLAAMSASEIAVVRTEFLAVLPGLEAAINAASANLDTDQAAVWKHNKQEVADRISLYAYLRRQLCAFIAIEPGPGLRQGGAVIRT